jgi:cytochrome b6-f complex iron-sulfur subunit
VNRREFIRSAIATTTLIAVGVAGLFEIAAKAANQGSNNQQLQLPPISSVQTGESSLSSLSSSSQASSSSTQTIQGTSISPQASAAPSGYFLVAQLSSLAGRSSAYFTHPLHGNSMLLSLSGEWRAFSATCTHRVCTLEFQGSELYCPCHGATFNATNGQVTRGPAQASLGEYGVLQQNGAIYVSDATIN